MSYMVELPVSLAITFLTNCKFEKRGNNISFDLPNHIITAFK